MHSRLGVYGDLISVNIRDDVFQPFREIFRAIVNERNICGVLRYDGIKYTLTLEIEGRSDFVSEDVPLDVWTDPKTSFRLTLIGMLEASEARETTSRRWGFPLPPQN